MLLPLLLSLSLYLIARWANDVGQASAAVFSSPSRPGVTQASGHLGHGLRPRTEGPWR
jgi:hypothetical protein